MPAKDAGIKGKTNMISIRNANVISNASWLEQTKVDISRGKESWGKLADSASTTLAEVLSWQTRKVREGKMTAAEYAAADLKARNADKARAGWYSFSLYAFNHRNGDNWQGTNIVVLDADAKFGPTEGAQFSFTAEQLRDRLDGLQYIALPTHSYTDQIPRWRIVVPLSEVVTDRTEFDAIAHSLAGKLDYYVDPRSYLPEQLWFSLSAPKGEWQGRVDRILVEG